MAKLILRAEDGSEKEFSLDDSGSVTIGRSPECELPIDDGQASRRHCSVVKLQSGWELADLGSTNGTLLNSVLVKRKKLRHGDIVRIGGTEISFDDPGSTGDAGEMTNCFVVYAKGDRKGEKVELTQQRTTLGRKESNTIVLSDGNASSYHCEIVRGLNAYTIRDLGSTNGTLVNNEMITEAPLTHGARIRIGSTRFVFQDPAMAEIDLELAGVDDDESDWGMMRELDLAAVRKRNPVTIVYIILFAGILGGLGYVTTLDEKSVGPTKSKYGLIEDGGFETRAAAFAWESDQPGLVRTSVKKGQLELSSADDAEAFYADRFDGTRRKYTLKAKLGARGCKARIGLQWSGLGLQRWSLSEPGATGAVTVTASSPPWASSVRVGVRIVGQGTATLDEVSLVPAGRSNPSEITQNNFTLTVVDGRAVDIAHGRTRAPILVNGHATGDPKATISIEDVDEHIVLTVTGSGDELGIEFTEERGYLTRGGFSGFGLKAGSDETYFARAFPAEGMRRDERVRKLLLGNPGREFAVVPASNDQRLTSIARVDGKRRTWTISGPTTGGKFRVRFKTDLSGESSLATKRMGSAQNLYQQGRWGEFLVAAERALAEFPFANKATQKSLNEKIAAINKESGSLSREAHAMIVDYEEFSDLQSLDRVVEILKRWKTRFQVQPGAGERGKEYAELDVKQKTLRSKAETRRQTQLAGSVLDQALYIHIPEGEVYSAAVMLTFITEWLPASEQAADARKELAKIQKEKPQVLEVLRALGLGGK